MVVDAVDIVAVDVVAVDVAAAEAAEAAAGDGLTGAAIRMGWAACMMICCAPLQVPSSTRQHEHVLLFIYV